MSFSSALKTKTTKKPLRVEDFAYKLAQDETKAPEVGEIVAEYHKTFENMMNEIIKNHKDYAPVYFVSVMTKKDHLNINVIRRRYVVRKTCPQPDWDQEIYSYNNMAHQLKLEWVLPTLQDARTILRNKRLYDEKLVKFIQDFQEGMLKIPRYSP